MTTHGSGAQQALKVKQSAVWLVAGRPRPVPAAGRGRAYEGSAWLLLAGASRQIAA